MVSLFLATSHACAFSTSPSDVWEYDKTSEMEDDEPVLIKVSAMRSGLVEFSIRNASTDFGSRRFDDLAYVNTLHKDGKLLSDCVAIVLDGPSHSHQFFIQSIDIRTVWPAGKALYELSLSAPAASLAEFEKNSPEWVCLLVFYIHIVPPLIGYFRASSVSGFSERWRAASQWVREFDALPE